MSKNVNFNFSIWISFISLLLRNEVINQFFNVRSILGFERYFRTMSHKCFEMNQNKI